MQVTSVRGTSKVHAGFVLEGTSVVFPACRNGSQSLRGTQYREVEAAITCATCLSFQPAPVVEAKPEPVKATRRPQINHKACSHAQTPLARRECRKAFWAAKATEQVAPATMVGKAVTWVGSTGKALGGMVTKELEGGKVMVRSIKGTPVRVAAEKLRLA